MKKRWGGLLLSVLVCLAAPVPALALSFQRVSTISDALDASQVDVYPQQALLLLDVDRDQKTDLVVGDPNSTVLKIYPGDGAGNFGAPVEVEVEISPTAFASGDLLGRGRSDFVVVSIDEDAIIVLLQNDNPFEFTRVRVEIAAAETELMGVALLEMSEPPDGRIDIAAVGTGPSDDNEEIGAYLFQNQGDGTFVAFASSPAHYVGSDPSAVVTADFNGNGRADLAISGLNAAGLGQIGVLLGSGNGSFMTGQFIREGEVLTGLVGADFNKDGRGDIAVIDTDADTELNFFLFLGNANGGFTNLNEGQTVVESFPSALGSADFDQNGFLDIVTVHDARGGGNGSMRFGAVDIDTYIGILPPDELSPPIGVRGIEFRDPQAAVATGEINGDTKPDLVVAMADDSIRVLINLGEVEPPTPTNTLPTGVPSETPTPTLPPSSSTPTATATQIPTAPYGLCDLFLDGRPVAVTTGDFDGNFGPDIAVADFDRDVVQILFNDAALFSVANCASGAADPDLVSVGIEPRAVAAADFGNNGTLDLAVATRDGVDVLSNDGNGNFTRTGTLVVGQDPRSIITTFINADALPDIVVANEASSSLSILLGRPDGSFEAARTIGVGRAATSVVAGQFNFDGLMDLAVTSDVVGDVSVLLQDPGQTSGFRNLGSFGRGTAITALTSGDFDGDGTLDLAIARPGGTNGVTQTFDGVVLPSGNVQYNFTAGVAVQAGPMSEGNADFSRDGHLDLVVANADSDTLTFALGDGEGMFPRTLIPFSVGRVPVALTIVDIDGDGIADVVVANEGSGGESGSVSILLSSRPPPTPTPTQTFTPSLTPTPTTTGSPTQTVNPSFTVTPTVTPTPTKTTTATVTLTPLASATPTNTRAGGLVQISGPGCQSGGSNSSPVWPLGLLLIGLALRRRRVAALLLLLALTPFSRAEAQTLPPYLRCDASLGTPTTVGTVGDFDDNGTPDLAVLTQGDAGLVMLTNRALFRQGSCPEALTVSSLPAVASPVAITSASFRMNGRLDLAVAGLEGVTILSNDGMAVFTSTGPLPAPPTPTPGFAPASDIVAANLNRDLFPDLVVANKELNRVTLLYNDNGSGSFTVAHTLFVGEPVIRIAAADFNVDGRTDVIALSDLGNATVFLQEEDGGFLAADVITVGGTPIDLGVAVTDVGAGIYNFSHSVIPDLAFTRRAAGQVVAYAGTLSGTETLRFDETSALDAGGPVALAIGDFNSDRILDVVSSDDTNDLIRFYLGDGEGSLGANETLPTVADPTGVLLADVDGDGRLDITTLSNTNLISFFLSSDPPSTPTFTPTPTGTVTPTVPPTGTITPTFTSTPTPTTTPTPTNTKTPTNTSTLTPTVSVTPTVTQLVAVALQGQGCSAGGGETSAAAWAIAAGFWLLARRRP